MHTGVTALLVLINCSFWGKKADRLPTNCWLGKCKADVQTNPWHCLSCPALKCLSIYRRHNFVVSLLLEFARSHSCHAHEIKKDLADRLPDGVIHFANKTVFFDVSGVSPSCPSYCGQEPGEAIRGRERSKTTKYFNFARDRDCAFVPFVLDSFGTLGPRALALVDSIVEESAFDLAGPAFISKSDFLTRLSRVWQTGNACIFREWAKEMRDSKGKFLGLRRAPSTSLPSPVLPAVPGAEVAFQVTIPKHGAPSAVAAAERDVAFEVTVPRPGSPPVVSSLAARHAGTCRA